MKTKKIATAETRNEKLKELLGPGGRLNADIYAVVRKIWQAQPTTEEPDNKLLEEFDNAVNRYLKYAIEYDRLRRSKQDSQQKQLSRKEGRK